MKNSKNQKRKLSKNELKEISGGTNRPICPRVISCTDPNTGEERYGVPGMQDGFCC
ncbi:MULTISPECIES: bacteriocin [unclassified Chryseobacterium]|uniref:bacteriocin n=1 Tax=unclassified Chryseobacterium TaxID=2593645 RepID=UPI000D70C310|nr:MULTISPECIES: bacteriocin [unclassified Chryseobacterium]PWW28616.1 bacteriocin-like protein [Chryseobacterium sp. AG844]